MLRDPQCARDRLVELLGRYARERLVRVTLVFDGAGPATSTAVEVPGRMQVVFSRSGQTADDLILAMVRAHANPRSLIVVSSDETDIGRVARELGARVMGAGAFFTRISRGQAPGRREAGGHDEKPGEIDVDYWLRQFEKRRNRDEGEEGDD